MSFVESEERRDLRQVAAELGTKYGHDYALRKIRAGEPLDELWAEAAKLGFLGVNIPEEFGGGGAGIYELSLILEELSAAGSGLLMMVVTPAICASIISRYGTPDQQRRWLPGFSDGSSIMAFAITEPEAGSNSHKLTTTGRRDSDGGGWIVNGRKVFISGVDQAEAVMVVGRTEDAKTGKLKPALWIVPTDAPGFEFKPIEMDVLMPERQYMLYLDDVQLPADALVGSEDAALLQLFAGLNPERIMVAALAIGTARYALDKAVAYAKERTVWSGPIGSHQGIAHPLAQVKVELELAKLMMQKAATLYDAGDDMGAADAANMAKYAAAEVNVRAVDQAIQSHGGNGLASEYGLGTLLGVSRVSRIAPVSREMLLNYVAQNTLGLPKSY
ncbi:acyl-CoA dehydrogenase family protein [Tenggerimyces flavus]|uniref:Acyl-CoA dehydrogenase family protein n=1 Tax=Tenggerimyces flavus TaxID=1708749 RepID=A0ABV7YL34_9ACTN|nr:acyl-CoA dehydrogenase family protein [Tenggerimyces flavus]MBM7789931.1 alkylation response protein AidB-like acyl-CoA dehydrogenase [Tenggerimyces flavus]